MKKIIGISILLFANVIILAHAIVLHHHNDIVVSFCNFLSENEKNEHNNNHSHSHLHHHNHDSNIHHHDCEFEESCLLSNIFLHANQDNHTFKDWGYTLIFAVVPNYKNEIEDYGNLPFRQKPFLISSYNHYVTHSLGMRAPPVC